MALITLIPAISAYFSVALIGWKLGLNSGDTILLTAANALAMAVIFYLGILAGVFMLAYLIFWMARTFGASANFSHSIELAVYGATPLMMAGLVLLFPEPILVMLVGLAGAAYSSYLLHTGIPIVMRIPEERSFAYAMSVLTGAWVLLLCAIVTAILLWSWAFMYIQ